MSDIPTARSDVDSARRDVLAAWSVFAGAEPAFAAGELLTQVRRALEFDRSVVAVDVAALKSDTTATISAIRRDIEVILASADDTIALAGQDRPSMQRILSKPAIRFTELMDRWAFDLGSRPGEVGGTGVWTFYSEPASGSAPYRGGRGMPLAPEFDPYARALERLRNAEGALRSLEDQQTRASNLNAWDALGT